MGKKCLKIALTLFIAAGLYSSSSAQGAGDVLRYSLQYPGYDAVSIVMPGVSDATGFGAYQENPASMALFDDSFFSMGLSTRYVSEDATYLENTSDFDDNQTGVGDIGFVYKVPTARGRLVIGGGYSQTHDFNRAFAGNARNNLTSLTDFYTITADDGLFNTAFDAFAIDNVDPDNQNSAIESIFRVDGPYQGINQSFEITERGQMGEYSAFLASEVLKNLVAGVSLGVIDGNYSYRRDFIETDTQNDYETQFEDEQGNLTGIDNIRSYDTIDADFSGFSLRLGAIYEVTPNINIGASYQFKNTIRIQEDFNTVITNTLDDGFQFEADAPAELRYDVTRPSRLNFGVTARDLNGFTLSAMAERIAYSDGRLEFDRAGNDGIEQNVERTVRANLEDVFNLRFGLEYAINEQFVPRVGYGYYPSPTGDFENSDLDGDRYFYSAGFSSRISENTSLNIGGQLGMWDDQNTLYSTTEFDEVATEEVRHWKVMAGITYDF